MMMIDLSKLDEATGGSWVGEPPAAVERVGIDTRERVNSGMFVAITGPNHDGHQHLAAAADAGALAAMVERVPEGHDVSRLPLLVVKNCRHALGVMARLHRDTLTETVVVAITGSVGKTTTRHLMESVLVSHGPGTASVRSFNNDLGVPLTLLSARKNDRWLLAEVGTNAPGEILHLGTMVQPDVVVITGTGRAHLEGFGDEASVAAEKASLLDTLSEEGSAFVNIDRPAIHTELAARSGRRWSSTTYGHSKDAELSLVRREVNGDVQSIETNDGFKAQCGLAGLHNAVNALPVIGVARLLGVDSDAIRRGLESATPPPMRMERIELPNATSVWNDAYNANPESMVAAFSTFKEMAAANERRVAIVGDMLELGEEGPRLHREVGASLAESKVDLVVGIGDGGKLIVNGAVAAGHAGETMTFDSSDDPHAIAAICQSGDQVLLKASRGVGLERILEAMTTGKGAGE